MQLLATGLAATRREDGSWKIDNAELARYLEANQHRFQSETSEDDQPETDVSTVAELRARQNFPSSAWPISPSSAWPISRKHWPICGSSGTGGKRPQPTGKRSPSG
jgi:hypothetical protein